MGKILISVLMPVYNAEDYLKEAISSVLAQSFEFFEFVIINDGSTDNSEAIIKDFEDERIKYIKNCKNIGLINSLNKGLEHCNGKYIARMDSDDICDVYRLEKQMQFLDSNDDYVVCSTRCYFISSGKQRRINITSSADDKSIRSFFLVNSPLVHPSVMFRRDVVISNNLHFESDYKDAEDYMFWIRLSEYGKMRILNDKLLGYRLSNTQISQSKNIVQLDSANRIRTVYFKKIIGDEDYSYFISNLNTFKCCKYFIKKYFKNYPDLPYFYLRKKGLKLSLKGYLLIYVIYSGRYWQVLPSIKRLLLS